MSGHRIPVVEGRAAVAGDFELPGGAGRGARIALDSGVLPIAATVELREGRPHAVCATVYRTARRLMAGILSV